ncbi:DeoR/GlpR family DNA-binding transcription regulator [Microbacterium enclense]|uniref:DeoR/GlpR family DNA-binding transcription regulator n=1 Tax=Microbacterium enclense TaxID=993073 RepID=UPI0021A69161|nr:DeoR/GlpR family DNA-binding transcription regulator [Microbacterium enclense]
MKQRRTRERREEILTLAADVGLANVEDLAERFGVTASTIRRDLAHLSDDGRLARTYGGAISTSHLPEASLLQRRSEALDAKRAITSWAADQIERGDSVFLDAGSTTALLARELSSRNFPATVTTSSLPVVTQLSTSTAMAVQCLGGRLRPLSGAFVGPLAEASLDRMSFDRAFVSVDGVTIDRGLCEAELEQTRFKEIVARRTRSLYVLAHAAKLGHAPFDAWARLDLPWTLVTDESAPATVVEDFRSAGITVVVAPAAGT